MSALVSETLTFEPMYPRVLGKDWTLVANSVQRAHLHGHAIRGQGSVDFKIGHGRFSRLIGKLLRLPPTGVHEAVVEVTSRMNGETWHRRFGSHGVVTEQQPIGRCKVRERFKLIEFDLEVTAADQGIRYKSCASRLRLGPARIPLPRQFEPAIHATEMPDRDGTRIDIEVLFPRDRILMSYVGRFSWSEF